MERKERDELYWMADLNEIPVHDALQKWLSDNVVQAVLREFDETDLWFEVDGEKLELKVVGGDDPRITPPGSDVLHKSFELAEVIKDGVAGEPLWAEATVLALEKLARELREEYGLDEPEGA